MATTATPASQAALREQRRAKKLFVMVGALGVVAAFSPIVLMAVFGVPKHVALRFRFWGICACCLIFSIHYTYSAVLAWRRGYIITNSGTIERKTRYWAFTGRLLVDVYMAILLGPMIIVAIFSTVAR